LRVGGGDETFGFGDVGAALQQIGRKAGVERGRLAFELAWCDVKVRSGAIDQDRDCVFELFALLLEQRGLRARRIEQGFFLRDVEAGCDATVDQVIKKFGERELEFKKERDNYTYTQTFVVQTIDYNGRADGEYRMTSDILFTPEGKRYEKVISAPAPTLERIQLSQQDLDDVEHVQPFVLTSDELPKYDVTYVGREALDELGTYVFDVKPKKIEKNQRYFQGRIWVDDRDLNIVKTDGKAVPDIIKHGNENIFPRFETFRENIEGHYWFPTYTRSDDELHFSTGAVHMRMTIKYANYKRFGSTIKIGPAIETKDVKPQK